MTIIDFPSNQSSFIMLLLYASVVYFDTFLIDVSTGTWCMSLDNFSSSGFILVSPDPEIRTARTFVSMVGIESPPLAILPYKICHGCITTIQEVLKLIHQILTRFRDSQYTTSRVIWNARQPLIVN